MTRTFAHLARQRGLRLNSKRRAILRILEEATERLSVREICERARRLEEQVSLRTVYLTLRKLHIAGLVTPSPSKEKSARYRKTGSKHTEQLIDVRSGRAIDFRNNQIAEALEETARRLGYRLLDYRLELLGDKECAAGPPRASRHRSRLRAHSVQRSSSRVRPRAHS